MTNHIRRLAVLAAATAILALLTGCGSQGTSPGTTAAPAAPTTGTITIAAFAFGGEVTVAPGATVTVQNNDSAPHNVVADDGSFKTDTIMPGKSGTFTAPSKAGRYNFICSIHPKMKSALVVGAAAGAATPADTGGAGSGY